MGGPATSADGARVAPLRLSAQGSVAFARGSAPLAPDVVQSISGLAEEFAFDFAMYEWRFGAAVGLNDRVSVEVAAPLRLTTTTARYRDSEGRNVSGLPVDDLHPEERTEKGLGDGTADLRIAAYGDDGVWVSLLAGVTIPLGTTAPDPWLDADSYTGTVRRSFFGTGTYDPRVGLDAGTTVGGVDVGVWSRAQASLYENKWGYQAGDRASGGLILGAGRSLGLDPFHGTAAVTARHAGQASWSGRPALNSGRTDVLAGLGVAWRWSPSWSVDVTVRRPLASWVEGGQVDWPLILSVGVYFVGGDGVASEPGSAQHDERSAMDTLEAAIPPTTHGPAPVAAIMP